MSFIGRCLGYWRCWSTTSQSYNGGEHYYGEAVLFLFYFLLALVWTLDTWCISRGQISDCRWPFVCRTKHFHILQDQQSPRPSEYISVQNVTQLRLDRSAPVRWLWTFYSLLWCAPLKVPMFRIEVLTLATPSDSTKNYSVVKGNACWAERYTKAIFTYDELRTMFWESGRGVQDAEITGNPLSH